MDEAVLPVTTTNATPPLPLIVEVLTRKFSVEVCELANSTPRPNAAVSKSNVLPETVALALELSLVLTCKPIVPIRRNDELLTLMVAMAVSRRNTSRPLPGLVEFPVSRKVELLTVRLSVPLVLTIQATRSPLYAEPATGFNARLLPEIALVPLKLLKRKQPSLPSLPQFWMTLLLRLKAATLTPLMPI